ncbi:MAG: hypothetical protein ACTHWW_10105 [Arthrobacter sp.]|uniref:hypothetical protein n=1 Tax=unclassified Arthrobacter TaxID=235627 RepID=UPI002655CB92|nr:hypothetical protein [Micrococcaceae bacterium]MDN5813136.1 hypothetical protein [Micrococcaceae bacterium]MDN5825075.1 hypothetical protein [Micrococcaceae bacterium]MDN5880219.1 hypothetical protein [Micrococcaceae bacterium]MDN5887655.1 hypothetical protein [Micrococcaceae bacterium]
MVEFIFLGVLLLVPVTYLIISASQLQAASFAAVGAADHAARTFATADTETEGAARARNAVEVALGNLAVDSQAATMEYRCSPSCLEPGSTVTVDVSIRVGLPYLPPGVDLDFGRSSSSATVRVDRYG